MRPSSALLAASGWIALAASALPALSPLRVLTAILFIAFCPGVAAMRLVAATRREDAARHEPLLATALAVGGSLAMATLVSEAFVLAGHFTAQRCVVVLSLLTGALVLASERYARRRRLA